MRLIRSDSGDLPLKIKQKNEHTLPPKKSLRKMPSLYIQRAAALTWACVTLVMIIVKFAAQGYAETMSYFTNWTFMFTSVYYSTETVFFFFDREKTTPIDGEFNPSMRLSMATVKMRFFVFWPLFGQNMLVFCLVYLMLLQNSSLITASTQQGGGSLSLGQVLDLDRAFHVVPTVFNLLYIILMFDDMRDCMKFIRCYGYDVKSRFSWWIICYQVFSGAISMIAFQLFLGFDVIYGTNLRWIYGLGFSLLILTITVGVLVYIFLPLRKDSYYHSR